MWDRRWKIYFPSTNYLNLLLLSFQGAKICNSPWYLKHKMFYELKPDLGLLSQKPKSSNHLDHRKPASCGNIKAFTARKWAVLTPSAKMVNFCMGLVWLIPNPEYFVRQLHIQAWWKSIQLLAALQGDQFITGRWQGGSSWPVCKETKFVNLCLVRSTKMLLKPRRCLSFSGHLWKIGEMAEGRAYTFQWNYFNLWTTNILQFTIGLIV